MPLPENPIRLAVIGAAHGIRGEVRLKSFTADPVSVGAYGPLTAADGRVFEIVRLRPQGDVLVAALKGVTDRNAAEALTGLALFVSRSKLPDDLDEEEFYHADLIGLDVVDETGEPVGRVRSVQNFGGGDILVIEGPGRAETLVPFTRAAVPQIDLASRRIGIDRLAAGLIGGEEDEGQEGEG